MKRKIKTKAPKKPKAAVKKTSPKKPKPKKSPTEKKPPSIPKSTGVKAAVSRIPLSAKKEIQKLKTENQDLKNRLQESEETIEAIRNGAVDALVISAPEGEQIYTLKGAEHPYRVFFETMNEGGVVISKEGLILACNESFERMVGVEHEKRCGISIYEFIPAEEHVNISRLITGICETKTDEACNQNLRVESVLRATGGYRVPVQLALSAVHEIDEAHVCVVITDLTDQKRAEDILRKSHDELEIKVKQRTAQLEKSKEDLQAQNEELQTIQEELQSQNEELRAARDELEESANKLTDANTELEAFTYSVSHDLRAPLRHMSGFARIVLEDYADRLDATGKNHLARIVGGSERMLRLIGDLLHFSQLTRLHIKRSLVDMSKLASDIIQHLSQADPDRKVEFELKGGLTGSADHQLIEVVLSNLLGNAWKFTSKTENAHIEFGVLKQNDKDVYYVRDNGAGFDPAHKGKLFHPFHRLHSENEFEGTGIGLAIVERIIRRHGGEVWAESESGKGATFFFTLN